MSKKVKSYCLEAKEPKSRFSIDAIKSQVVPVAQQSLVLAVSAFCLYYFYNTTTGGQLDQLTYGTFLISCANALLNSPIFQHQSFCELKLLMDYAQEVLPLPFLTADLWIKFELAPSYIGYMHAAFGLAAFFYLVVFEFKRSDLTDLAMILNFFSLMGLAMYMQNPFAGLAALIACSFYVKWKRMECCFETHKLIFMMSCALFNIGALCSFDPDSWMPNLEGGSGE